MLFFTLNVEKQSFEADQPVKERESMLFKMNFGHIEIQILQLMYAKGKTKMPAIFTPPHFYIGKITFFWGNEAK